MGANQAEVISVVEDTGFEPVTFAMPLRRSPN